MSGEHYLKSLFEPRTVALVGATEKPGKVGALVAANLRDARFAGRIYGVNPKYSARCAAFRASHRWRNCPSPWTSR